MRRKGIINEHRGLRIDQNKKSYLKARETGKYNGEYDECIYAVEIDSETTCIYDHSLQSKIWPDKKYNCDNCHMNNFEDVYKELAFKHSGGFNYFSIWHRHSIEDYFNFKIYDLYNFKPIEVIPCSFQKVNNITVEDQNEILPININLKKIKEYFYQHEENFIIVNELFKSFIDEMKEELNQSSDYLHAINLFKNTMVFHHIIYLRPFWIRTLWSWKFDIEDKDNKVEVFRSLFRHLFVKYPVPEFLYQNCYNYLLDERVFRNTFHETKRLIIWLILIGQGIGLSRYAKQLEWNIPRGFEHRLFQVPKNLNFIKALLFAKILLFGGTSIEFFRIVENDFFAYDGTYNRKPFLSFLKGTIEWMVKYRNDLDDDMCSNILIWAVHEHTETRDFSWSRRTPTRALAAAREYQLSLKENHDNLEWENHGWDWTHTYTYSYGVKTWALRELISSNDLYVEGSCMHHCVSTYAYSCKQDDSAIFSMTLNGERCLTVEVDIQSKKIVQARGLQNRSATIREDKILKLWYETVVKTDK